MEDSKTDQSELDEFYPVPASLPIPKIRDCKCPFCKVRRRVIACKIAEDLLEEQQTKTDASKMADEFLNVLATPIKGVASVRVVMHSNAKQILAAGIEEIIRQAKK